MSLPTLLKSGYFGFDKQATVPDEYSKRIEKDTPIDIIIDILKSKIDKADQGTNGPEHKTYFLNSRTGSGKSTVFIQHLYENFIKNKYAEIYVSEPRVVLCGSNANEIARWNTTMTVGDNVGYLTGPLRVRCSSKINAMYYCTPQILANKLQLMLESDNINFNKTKIVVVDETHLLDISILQALYLARTVINKHYKHESCPLFIFTSATMDINAFVRYFFESDREKIYKDFSMIGYVEGASNHKVDLHYIPDDKMLAYTQKENNSIAFDIIGKYYFNNYYPMKGDVLIFSPKTKLIDACASVLEKIITEEKIPVFNITKGLLFSDVNKWRNGHRNKERILIIQFARDLSPAATELLQYPVDPDAEALEHEKKIIISTPVLETGKTISTLTLCIDTGTALGTYYNPLSTDFFGNNLKLLPVNKSGAIQRMGRIGREQPGTCLRFYTENNYKKLPNFDYPSTVNNYCLSDLIFNFLAVQHKHVLVDIINENKYLYKISIDILIRSINDMIKAGFYNMFGIRSEYRNSFKGFDKNIVYIQYLYYVKQMSLFDSALLVYLNEHMLPNEFSPTMIDTRKFRIQLSDIRSNNMTVEKANAIRLARNLVTNVMYNQKYKSIAYLNDKIFNGSHI